MEDYNQIPFRQMVGEKIAKKDSERGADAQMGFSLHGGKPIKELYRTVYTGGDDRGYYKEPVTKIHRTVTNDEGVTEKTLKSDHVTRDQNEADLKNAVRNPQPSHEYGPWGSLESDEEIEHEEKSIRDMVAQKNATRFVKYTEPESVDEDIPIGEDPESEPVTWNVAPENGKYPPEVYQRFIDTNKKYGISIPQDQMDGWLDDIWDMSQYTASGSTTGAAKDPDAAAGANLLFNAAYRR